MTLEEHLDNVTDKESFIAFVIALIEDREIASKMEKENPDSWRWDGANGWQNSTVESFLGGALAWFDSSANRDDIEKPPGSNQWKNFAEFLYYGKIYE